MRLRPSRLRRWSWGSQHRRHPRSRCCSEHSSGRTATWSLAGMTSAARRRMRLAQCTMLPRATSYSCPTSRAAAARLRLPMSRRRFAARLRMDAGHPTAPSAVGRAGLNLSGTNARPGRFVAFAHWACNLVQLSHTCRADVLTYGRQPPEDFRYQLSLHSPSFPRGGTFAPRRPQTLVFTGEWEIMNTDAIDSYNVGPVESLFTRKWDASVFRLVAAASGKQ